ncbi:SDR family NAD(P)-dependent oxidoreductase [Corallincola holothuriorum]|uniref:SDR family NAD(P)-dependent oxidoreductase n=1 Tax=Corallincola holothuriorum TaxID=2282215 RepID=A0A368NIY5_9GAMM|nr:SDR family oxidoreductase [Corallincola holothuriorum]RCU49624.1 SDR family NAD(P)-dependent oxidoreductase [Corallincola holothuriorum]
MQIVSKVVAITGAGSGLGRAMALSFAAQGAHLALLDLNADALSDTASLIEAATGQSVEGEPQQTTHAASKPPTCRCYVLDVTNEAEVEHCFDAIANDFGALHVLINSAGIMRDNMLLKVKEGKVVDKMSLGVFNTVLHVNLTGSFLCGREAAAQMVQHQCEGVIINLASVSRAGNMGQSNYSAAKAGVSAMTVTWAKELARFGIRAAAIAPGVFATPMTEVMKPEAMERLKQAIPAKRLGEAEEIAHAARFIIENDYYTGRVLELDGGIRV